MVSGETLLVPIRGEVAQCDNIFILNGTGGFLWPRLDGATSVSELSVLLSEHFEGATPDSTRSDVESFLSEIDARGLIVWKALHD